MTGKWHPRYIVYLAILVGLTACAAETPEPQEAARPDALETLVASDVDAAWNTLVRDLRGRDFEINSLAEADRKMRVLVQTNIPSTYVDCGEISVRSRHPELGDRNYNFPAANSARYLVADRDTDSFVDVERKTTLNAIADVMLTPVGDSTLVRVGALYVMNFRTREFGSEIKGRSLDNTLDFKSFRSAEGNQQVRESARIKSVSVECKPTGELERRIVSVLTESAG